MAALEVLALNTTVPRIEAPQTGDTYTFPRAADIPLGTAALPAVAFTGDLNTGLFSPTADTFAVTTGGAERLRVDSTGNLGIGVTPGTWPSGNAVELGFAGSAIWGGNLYMGLRQNLIGSTYASNGLAAGYDLEIGVHRWYTAAAGNAGNVATLTERMRLDSAGNLGLGVTPSAWSVRSLQLAGSPGLSSVNGTDLTYNAFYDGAWKYVGTARALLYSQAAGSGEHRWFNAASGTAGTAISFTQAMTLDASGNLGLGTTSPAGRLHVANTNAGGAQFLTLQTTNTTQGNCTIRWQGSAGVNQAFIGSYVNTADTGNLEFGNSTTTNLTLTSGGNLGLGTATFGTSAATVLSIANGTEPTTGPANTVQFFSVDRSAGNTIPAIYCEGTGVTDAAITNVTVTNKIAMKVNGTIYYLLATTSAA